MLGQRNPTVEQFTHLIEYKEIKLVRDWSLHFYILVSFVLEVALQASEREMLTPIQQQNIFIYNL